MAAIAAAPPTAAPALSSEKLQERFMQFAAATNTAGDLADIDKMYSTITADAAGMEWLQGVLDATNLQGATSSVAEFAQSLACDSEAPAVANFMFVDTACFLSFSVGYPIDKKGNATFKGRFQAGPQTSPGTLKWVASSDLSTVKTILMNASNFGVFAVLKDGTGNGVAFFSGKPIKMNTINDEQPIVNWYG